MTEFDPVAFESMIEKVVIGEVGRQGNKDSAKITFVFKTGYTSEADAPPPKKAGRSSKKGNKVGSKTVEFGKNNTYSREIGHTVVILYML